MLFIFTSVRLYIRFQEKSCLWNSGIENASLSATSYSKQIPKRNVGNEKNFRVVKRRCRESGNVKPMKIISARLRTTKNLHDKYLISVVVDRNPTINFGNIARRTNSSSSSTWKNIFIPNFITMGQVVSIWVKIFFRQPVTIFYYFKDYSSIIFALWWFIPKCSTFYTLLPKILVTLSLENFSLAVLHCWKLLSGNIFLMITIPIFQFQCC